MKLFDRELHGFLFFTVVIIMLLGCMVIYSAASVISEVRTIPLAFKQLIFVLLAMGIVFLIFFIDVKFFFNITWLYYFFTIGLLVSVFFIGKSSHGAQRWIALGFMDIQPSEFAKIAIIMAVAKYMSLDIDNNQKLHYIVLVGLITLVPFILILKQPDLGTAMTLIPTLICMLFMAGIKKRYFLMLFPFAFIPLIILMLAKNGTISIEQMRHILFFLKPYQQNRILVFIDPNIDPQGLSYNLIQSQIAIGSGGLWGKGLLKGTQTHLQFLPERHTDFIFSVVGEEWGLIGGGILLFLYLSVLMQGFSIAESCQDFYMKLVATGIVMLFLSHIAINIGMTIGLMPIAGLPLPLISYGGSSLMTNMISLGLLLNFYSNKEKIIRRSS
ncbi:MAG: rod shape-determining protein RodA [Candidatus Aureabacteria bacterium]|nr:rod shape-determining protein RodA [Candidatus Auribacterota bacterium]